MRRRIWRHIIISVLVLLASAFVGCSVHEFPEPQPRRPFELVLDFTQHINMGFYQTIDYSTRGESSSRYDIRYTVNIYSVDDNDRIAGSADTTIVVTKSELADLNHTLRFYLRPGKYDFLVWADYVKRGSKDDLFYKTANFEEIILSDRSNYVGNTDYRDAFRGEQIAEVYDNAEYTSNATGETVENRVVVEMKRPMAKFKFESNDVVKFLTDIIKKRNASTQSTDEAESKDAETDGAKPEDLKKINPDDYRVVFRYSGFTPCSFNMFTNKPADAWTGLSFESKMSQIDDNNVELGFDYVFVNGGEAMVVVSVEVYDTDGELLSRTKPVNVPLMRNMLTIVRGNFLTVKASGGISIDPSFDGEYNYEYK